MLQSHSYFDMLKTNSDIYNMKKTTFSGALSFSGKLVKCCDWPIKYCCSISTNYKHAPSTTGSGLQAHFKKV